MNISFHPYILAEKTAKVLILLALCITKMVKYTCMKTKQTTVLVVRIPTSIKKFYKLLAVNNPKNLHDNLSYEVCRALIDRKAVIESEQLINEVKQRNKK